MSLTATDGDRVRTYGNTDLATQPATYFFEGEGATDEHAKQFEAVVEKLESLNKAEDGNGWPPVEFVAIRRSSSIHFVAYRFTSDWAYHRFSGQVQELGWLLGRGTFRPFQRSGDYDFYYRK